nr:zinc-dependent peptidase [uncultured Albidiferax sp.]
MWDWLRTKRQTPIPDALWLPLLARHGFLAELPEPDQLYLRELSRQFLAQKEFHGAHGLQISDGMALAIAAQACLPLLYLPRKATRWQPGGLGWYGDFVGINVYPGEVLARRESVDEAGVVHRYREALLGEAMDGGPVVLSWTDVAQADASASLGTNLVIHEFAHKIAMQGGLADDEELGYCPPLPPGFLGSRSARAAVAAWYGLLQPAYEGFREKVIIAERFSGAPTWLDPYAAESMDEFFAVACEAYWVQRARLAQEFPLLMPLMDGFFRPGSAENL